MKKTKKIIQCRDCDGLAKFQFNSNTLILEGGCQNGHIFDNLSYNEFKELFHSISCSKYLIDLNKNDIIKKCYFCQKNLTCNCNGDNNNKKFCLLHGFKYDLFYENEKCDLCEECKKSFGYIDKKSEIKTKIEDYSKKINKLIDNLYKKKEEILERYYKLNNFLCLLSYINDNLLKKFNYYILDTFNYDNFNYFFDLIKDLEEKMLMDNFIFNIKLDIIQKNEFQKNNNDKEKKKNISYLYIKDYDNFHYFKDNIFYYYNNDYNQIKLYEYNGVSLNNLTTYTLNNNNYFSSIIQNDYNHFFVFNYKTIDVIEYDDNKKTFKYNGKLNLWNNRFKTAIANKNGNIVVIEKNHITIYNKNDNAYESIIEDNINFSILQNVNDNMFLLLHKSDYNNYVSFYDSTNYNNIKKIHFKVQIKYIYNIKHKEQLAFIQEGRLYCYRNYLFIVNSKYLEIVQIINYDKEPTQFLINNNKILLDYYFEKGKNPKIRKYDDKNGSFNDYLELNITNLNYNVSLSDNYMFLNTYQDIIFYKLKE